MIIIPKMVDQLRNCNYVLKTIATFILSLNVQFLTIKYLINVEKVLLIGTGNVGSHILEFIAEMKTN